MDAEHAVVPASAGGEGCEQDDSPEQQDDPLQENVTARKKRGKKRHRAGDLTVNLDRLAAERGGKRSGRRAFG